VVTIGILGGIASGKTFVAKQLEALGARRIDADQLAHSVLDEPEVKSLLVTRWGAEVLSDKGAVDRAKIAAIVFAVDPPGNTGGSVQTGASELAFLETVTHPRIAERIRDQIRAWERDSAVAAAVLDAAVLLKAKWNHVCDTILFVDVPLRLRLERALARGWSKEEFTAREAAQESLDTKRAVAHGIIDNGGTAEQTLSQVQEFWHALHFPPPPSRPH
jgi:dephospho-CoA kinase